MATCSCKWVSEKEHCNDLLELLEKVTCKWVGAKENGFLDSEALVLVRFSGPSCLIRLICNTCVVSNIWLALLSL